MQSIIEHNKNVHLYPFDKSTMTQFFFSLIEENIESFKSNLMKIHLKIEGQSFLEGQENISNLLEKSFGFLIAKANLDFSKKVNQEDIYGYIYINEWSDKPEISFWRRKSTKQDFNLEIKFKKIIKIFLNQYFSQPNIESNDLVVWGTRYIAEQSCYFANLVGFKKLFSFHDYMIDFKEEHKKLKPTPTKIVGLVLTHYFCNTRKNYAKLNQKKIENSYQEGNNNVNDFVIDNEFKEPFLIWENFTKKYSMDLQQKNIVLLEGGKIIKISYNNLDSFYYQIDSSQIYEEINFRSFNILLTLEIVRKFAEIIQSNNLDDCNIKNVGITFHIPHNVIQISIFDEKEQHVKTLIIKNFEWFLF